MERQRKPIAAEQSTGTWTEVRSSESRLAARILRAEGTEVDMGFPEDLFEPGNIPQYLSVVAGNLFGLGALHSVRLQDVAFPKSLVRLTGDPGGALRMPAGGWELRTGLWWAQSSSPRWPGSKADH
ncbi:MAG TPA: hypothetical protein PLI05_10020 [Methanotrichaceae archaeon]|nr:hypothetical protein [Methanotrichaceae archaeon]HQF17389.1 hypothetical protein [Methanotrichaceae archaeon]HQI91151.1 hypothetical protein [Methanotrichaceae archaeon]HQJ29220.1 hypothetical protein [Methanotrichaceae archaeon]